ncbi:exported hypothetical protein [Candidatus Nitrotoga sp. BS]|uniref:hypothetical protein n=1 Tax=Candidatus Nitrotoga sp. BS TaxID=2890408 RepID=UPI001EF1C7F6|nr:hypothetical protein [Candidatus Nitrotoga sp. BS]CAH1198638.1 exported hypothetical protein [Candidatus Nitrotoga sp. BS]
MAIQSLSKPVYVLLFALGSPWALASQTIDVTRMKACALTPAEIKAALRLDVRPGVPHNVVEEMPSPGGKSFYCEYAYTSPNYIGFIGLRQDWLPLDSLAKSLAELDKFVVGKNEAVSNDPDKAHIILNPNTPNQMTLYYVRKNVRTDVLVFFNELKAKEMRPKLLKLKRVP